MKNNLKVLLLVYFLLILAVLITPRVAQSQTPISPTPTVQLESKVSDLELRLNELEQNSSKPQKDVWDKLSSISILIAGVFVSGLGIFFNYRNSAREIRTQEVRYRNLLQIEQVQTVHTLLPLLQSKDEQDKETAYMLISLFNEELAARIFKRYPTLGITSAVRKIASDPDEKVASPAKELLSRFEKQTLDQLKKICNEYKDGNFEEHLFISGTYGQNFWPSQLELLINNKWVERWVDERGPEKKITMIRITEAGRKAAKCL